MPHSTCVQHYTVLFVAIKQLRAPQRWHRQRPKYVGVKKGLTYKKCALIVGS
jgi:hypothetical protein